MGTKNSSAYSRTSKTPTPRRKRTLKNTRHPNDHTHRFALKSDSARS